MAVDVVNLDALIPREDFDAITAATDIPKIPGLRIEEMGDSFFSHYLRKPDFQRETSNWEPKKIVDLVRTFLDGELVPAVILWQSGSNVFVIDGAHRLSALIAWRRDDYGDGEKSRPFYNHQIPEEQKTLAEKTRALIAKEVGSYQEHLQALQKPKEARDDIASRVPRLGILALPVQWVPGGDARKAEEAFFKINQGATEIDPTELRILKARTSANAIAARAIVRGGGGHEYWSRFSQATANKIALRGNEVHETLYTPPLNSPIRTLDLPIAGPGYGGQTLPLAFDLVNLANDQKIADSSAKQFINDALQEDKDGTATVRFLDRTLALVQRVSGKQPQSLGFHPAIYTYSATGKFQPAAFMGLCAFVKALEPRKDGFLAFTSARERFETFLLERRQVVSEIVHRRGSGMRSTGWVRDFYLRVFDLIAAGKSDDEIEIVLGDDPSFDQHFPRRKKKALAKSGKFTGNAKTAAFLREALETSMRCKICRGLLHMNSMHADHKDRRAAGGSASEQNAQMTHPFCNTTVKG